MPPSQLLRQHHLSGDSGIQFDVPRETAPSTESALIVMNPLEMTIYRRDMSICCKEPVMFHVKHSMHAPHERAHYDTALSPTPR